jgi:hypothetical protein
MSDASWQDDWRPAEPAPDFARRVVLELERQERLGAHTLGRRRASMHRRWSPLGILGVAALLLSGAAAAALGARGEPALANIAQESSPTAKAASATPPLQLVTPRAPMVPERGRPWRPLSARAAPVVALPESPRPVPIHYPPCHCSSGAVVCSCVD